MLDPNAHFTEAGKVDVLSEVLSAVRLEGALFFNAEFSAPWCFSSSPSAAKEHFLSHGAKHHIIYHFLTEGRAYARLPGGPRQELSAGDIVIVPHGDTHLVGNGAPVRPMDSFRTFAKNVAQGLKLVRFGGGGELTRFVCGYLSCEQRLSEVFLAGLPRILRVHAAKEPSGQWLEQSIRFSVDKANGSHAGSGLVLSKLSEVLFVETLRRYINMLPSHEIGWLSGARDPVIGQALALLHKEPAQPWTVANLAKRVGQSRTRLAERFRHFLEESPMAYLTKWRLKLAAEILRTTEDSVAAIAAEVGYGSEAAFNRAFKRDFDCPPAQFRRSRSAPTTLAPSKELPVRLTASQKMAHSLH